MPPRKRGLSTSGLDTVIPISPTTSTPQPADSNPSPPAARREKEKIGGYYDLELAERIRNAVSACAGHPEGPRGLTEFLIDAAERELTRLQDERNNGQAFPQRTHRKLLTGPRPG